MFSAHRPASAGGAGRAGRVVPPAARGGGGGGGGGGGEPGELRAERILGRRVRARGAGFSRPVVEYQVSRRRDCHFTDTPVLSLLKHLLKVEGGAAE